LKRAWLLAVALVATVGLALAFVVPLIQRVRAVAERARCADNLRRISLSGLADSAQTEKAFPAGTVANPQLAVDRRLAWTATLLERWGQADWARTIDRTAGWDDGPNAALARRPLPLFVCPAVGETPGVVTNNYVGLSGLGPDSGQLPPDSPRAGLFRFDAPTPLTALTDGAAATIAVVETNDRPGAWLAGGFPTVRPILENGLLLGVGRPFGGCHPGVVQLAMADGSVRVFSESISRRVFESLATIAGGNVQPDDP
jgi:hypothetical protein